MILSVNRRAFSKIDLDRADTELQKISQFSLVPLNGFGITYVERCILERKLATFVLDVITLRHHFVPQIVFAGEVSVLPETDVKSLLLQIGDHLCGIAEA